MNDQHTYAEQNNAENRNPYSAAGNSGENPYKTAQGYQNGYTDAPQQESNGLSIASMVLGVLSLMGICCCGSSLLFGIAAIVCALVRRNRRGVMDGMAVAGLVMGIIGTLFGLMGVCFWGMSLTGLGVGSLLPGYSMFEYYLG